MIISRTPFRISLFGGGTDYPSWFTAHGGAVLAGTIDKYCYLTCRFLPPFFEHRFRLVYSKVEMVREVDEIAHPAVRATLKHLGLNRGLELHHDGDLPARSGMGSSSSFTVGLLHALYSLQGQMVSRRKLAEEAIHVEQQLLKETVGCQDQVLAAYGGFNHISFLRGGDFDVRPVTIPESRREDLSAHMMLFYTGIKRTASQVAGGYVADFGRKKRQLRILRDMVEEALSIIASSAPLEQLGDLLHEAWHLKKSLGEGVSNAEVDEVYDAAMEAGATGGKLLGAGGGGFMVFIVPPRDQEAVRQRLSQLIHVPVKFCSGGSQIIFCEPQQDYSRVEEARALQNLRQFRELHS